MARIVDLEEAEVVCIYHGNCADGFASAWVVRHYFTEKLPQTKIAFHPGVYQQDPPNVAGKHVLIVDFSYKKPVLDKLIESAASLLILDHHKSAAEDLAHLPDPLDANGWLPTSGAYAFFSGDLSGAGLTWEHFYTGADAPQLILHVQDRDLWRFELEGTREIQAAVFSYPYDFKVWDTLMAMPPEVLCQEGEAIERKHHKDIAELLAVCKRRMMINGYEVSVASLPYTLASDACHEMAKGMPFAACYYDKPHARVFSLRSNEGEPRAMDVSEIAKEYGGGGHKHAAGFEVPRTHTLAMC